MEYLILYIKIKCMHKGVLVKCNNSTKSHKSLHVKNEERKKTLHLSPNPLSHSQNHENKHKKHSLPSSFHSEGNTPFLSLSNYSFLMILFVSILVNRLVSVIKSISFGHNNVHFYFAHFNKYTKQNHGEILMVLS